MRIVHVKDRTFVSRLLDGRPQINGRDALRREIREEQIVLGRLARILRPMRQVVLVDRRPVRRRSDEEADAPRLKLLVHVHKHVCRVSHPLIPNEETCALAHRFLAQVEHASVAAYQHRVVAEPEQRPGHILVGADQDLTKAEMVPQICVDLLREFQPIATAHWRVRRRR